MAWPIPNSSSMVSIKSLAISFLALLLILLNAARADINGDQQALLAFKANLTNARDLTSWNESTDICTSWKGIICSNQTSTSAQRVIELRLPGQSLYGSIRPDTLGNLDALQVLSLRGNTLSGSFPEDLANCTYLRELYLQNNSFSGPLPSNFTVWPLLRNLDLSFNNFSGQIPPSLNNLTGLRILFLQGNKFSGSIPLVNPLPLRNFSVADNQLNGSIPSWFSSYSESSFEGNSGLCGAPLRACDGGASPPTPPPASPPTSPSGGNKLSTGAIAGIVIGALAATIVAFLVCFLLFIRRNKKQGHAEDLYGDGRAKFEATSLNRKASGRSVGNEGVAYNKLTFMGTAKQTFDLDDLLRASAEVLGKGSLGTSYKAIVDGGQPLCVKRFREVATEREDTCKHIEMLGALQHPNLVPLRAYFFAPKGKLLVSDYMPKGSLSYLLHGHKGAVRNPLDWQTRLAIAADAARGLVFLHSKKVVHGNIKSSNVILDSDREARLTDYSLVQLVPLSTEPGSSLRPNAYTAPEIRGDLRKLAYKGDVYAFGVLLLELVTGKSPNNLAFAQGGSRIDELVHWVEAHFPQDVEGVLDPLLFPKANDRVQDEMRSLLEIALPCVSASPEKRPHMVELVTLIESLRKPKDGPESTDFYFTQAE